MNESPCPGCGKQVSRRPEVGMRYCHKCPHGKWCLYGYMPYKNIESNQEEFCEICVRWEKVE